MAEIINPHDKFFKEMLTQPEAARIFLRDFLPPTVAEQLDLSRLQLVKDSFIDETLQAHFSDLVYEVALRHADSALVCVLFEHKSYVDSMTPLQVLRYMVHGWEYSVRQRNRLWPVIPVVVYHGAAPWIVATNFQGLFELPEALSVYVPEFHYAPTGTCAPLSGSRDSLRGVGRSERHCGECAGGNRGRCAGRRCNDRYNCTGMAAAGIAAGIAAGVAAGVAAGRTER
jgi:hypothetical protein